MFRRLTSYVNAVALCLAGCGSVAGAGAGTLSTTQAQRTDEAKGVLANRSYMKRDGDKDPDDGYGRVGGKAASDEGSLLDSYATAPTPAQTRTIDALVRRYYAASDAGDATRACELVVSSLSPPGSPASCAAALSPLLRVEHAQLVADRPATMVVTSVHLKGSFGIAILGFEGAEGRFILVQREGASWKVAALSDSPLP